MPMPNTAKELWSTVGLPALDSTQWIIWDTLYPAKVLKTATLQTAVKWKTMHGAMTQEHVVRFCSAVANRLSKETTVA
jgi:hypothetical protein